MKTSALLATALGLTLATLTAQQASAQTAPATTASTCAPTDPCFDVVDTVDLHNISNHALPDGLVVAVRAEHEEHVVRVVGVGRGHALVVDLRLVREGEVPLRLFQGREAALGTPRRERAGAQRAEGPGGQHRGGSAVGGDYGGSRGSSLCVPLSVAAAF